MSEFKAQLLGLLIVISIFSVIIIGYKSLVKSTWNKINQEVSSLELTDNE